MSNKLIKYAHKYASEPKQVYLEKIAYYLLNHHNSQTGGDPTIKSQDLDSLLDYLRDMTRSEHKTERKYFVILYGPPASGKTLARKIGCHLIKKVFYEYELTTQDIFKTFMDTGVDEITYSMVSTHESGDGKKTVAEVLIENKVRIIGKDASPKQAKKKISELVKSSFDIYRKNRADSISELMYYLSVFLGKNIFFETASGSAEYIGDILKTIVYYGYIPVVVYPLVRDVITLYDRSVKRGLKEGRFLECGDQYGITNNMKLSKENYPKLKETICSQDEFIIYMYNAKIDIEDFNELKNWNFDKLDKYVIEEIACYVQSREQFKIRNISDIRHNDYDKIIELNMDCGSYESSRIIS